MKKYKVFITDQADKDIRNIYEYIAYSLKAVENAVNQIKRIEKAIYSLDSFPERHRLYELQPWKNIKLHILPVDNYCVFYVPDVKHLTVTIIRVIYGKMDIKKQLTLHTNI